jgi:hypothetical protein
MAFDALQQHKDETISRNAVSAQLKRWKSLGRVKRTAKGYEKL